MIEESEEIKQFRSGFRDFYNQKLLHLFVELEDKRMKYFWYFILGLAFIFIILPAVTAFFLWIFIYSGGGTLDYDGDWSGPLSLFMLVAIMVISAPIMRYNKVSKNNIMPEFIKYFGNFNYSYQKTVSDNILEKSRLFGAYNRHSGDDYFSGVYKGTNIVVSEENLLMHTRSGKHSSTTTVFDGVVVMLSMAKQFNGQTVVFKDWGMFNGFHSLGNMFNSLKKVTLEDSVFEKEFEVYSDDQLEARYLLTTAFMERMLKVRNAFRSNKIQFSFFDNNLLIAISTSENMFETSSLFKSCTNRKMINLALEQIISILNIADILQTGKKN